MYEALFLLYTMANDKKVVITIWTTILYLLMPAAESDFLMALQSNSAYSAQTFRSIEAK